MNKFLFAAGIAVISLLAGPSFAADIPPAPPAPYGRQLGAPSPVHLDGVLCRRQPRLWLGARLDHPTRFSAEPYSTIESGTLSGVIGGGQAGFNWQTGFLVLGVEGDFQWSGQKTTVTVGN